MGRDPVCVSSSPALCLVTWLLVWNGFVRLCRFFIYGLFYSSFRWYLCICWLLHFQSRPGSPQRGWDRVYNQFLSFENRVRNSCWASGLVELNFFVSNNGNQPGWFPSNNGNWPFHPLFCFIFCLFFPNLYHLYHSLPKNSSWLSIGY